VESAAEACAHHIIGILEEARAVQDRATVALSGGGTPKFLFQHMAQSGFRWDRVHFFWADERCVPPADPQSNYHLAEQFLFIPARIPHSNVHRVHGELPPAQAATRYVEEIRGFFGLAKGELPRFDIVQLGMGPDGHTASLFPGSPALEDRESIAAAISAPKPPPWRVTLMPGVLLAAGHSVFLVGGEDKAEAVRQVFQGDYDPRRYPAQMVSRHGQGVTWFLDQAAASLIDGTAAAPRPSTPPR
jgi:6-phosphogluconolactonase